VRSALALFAPALAVALWGWVDFGGLGRYAEPLRAAEELTMTGLAAVALVALGQGAFGMALGLLSLYHGAVYASGACLLAPPTGRRPGCGGPARAARADLGQAGPPVPVVESRRCMGSGR
jgi:hypothetical protein